MARPGRGELLVRQMAAGVNFMDISQRNGRSPIPIELPGGLGNEAAGLIEAVGEGVSDVTVGDRIAYAGGGAGAYAEMRLIPARLAIKLPDEVGFAQAAAMMLKGMTAQVLLKQIYRAKAGDTVLFHAASSGVGLIACQWLKHLGVTVIGTVSSDEKLQRKWTSLFDQREIEGRVSLYSRDACLLVGKADHAIIACKRAQARLDSYPFRGHEDSCAAGLGTAQAKTERAFRRFLKVRTLGTIENTNEFNRIVGDSFAPEPCDGMRRNDDWTTSSRR